MKSNMLLQLREMGDVTTLQPSTLHACGGTGFRFEYPWVSSAVSMSAAFVIYGTADIFIFPRNSPKDFLAVHSAVSAVPMIAVAHFSAWGSSLHMEVIRALQRHPMAGLWKITYILDWSAECPSSGVGAVCIASACIPFAAVGSNTITHTVQIAVALL